ncbi:MAG: hypothetical protein ACQEW9_00830 [Bacteroidota bacterium]
MNTKLFPRLHLWLILPFVLTLAGFHQYWLGFSSVPFHWHLHGISATAWYLILIAQPWIYQHRSIHLHRKVGMIGLVLAGFVTASGLNMVKGNLQATEASPLFDVRYSLSLLDCLFIGFFMLSVILAVMNARNTASHARWMISTVFWVLSPAIVRLSYVPLLMVFQPESFSDLPFVWSDVFVGNQVLIILVLLFLIFRDFQKEKKIYASYVLVTVVQVLAIPILLFLKDSPWLRELMNSVFL